MNPEEPGARPERSTSAVVAAVLGAFILATVGLLLFFELVEGHLF